MKVVVRESFIDKYTHVNHPVGEELELTAERLAEINSVSTALVEVLPEVKSEPRTFDKKRKKGE